MLQQYFFHQIVITTKYYINNIHIRTKIVKITGWKLGYCNVPPKITKLFFGSLFLVTALRGFYFSLGGLK